MTLTDRARLFELLELAEADALRAGLPRNLRTRFSDARAAVPALPTEENTPR